MDGLDYQQEWKADALKPLLKRLKGLHEFATSQEALETENMTRAVAEQTALTLDEFVFVFIRFFDFAQAAVPKELGLLAASGTS
jgi:hypothetical protein